MTMSGYQPAAEAESAGLPAARWILRQQCCAAQTKSTFIKLGGPQLVQMFIGDGTKLAGPHLVQMFIGDGAKLVRDTFALAKEKAPAINLNWMLLAPRGLTSRRRETGRFRGPCWSC